MLAGAELRRCQPFYFQQYPTGRERAAWPDIVYVLIRPRSVRYSDHRPTSSGVEESDL